MDAPDSVADSPSFAGNQRLLKLVPLLRLFRLGKAPRLILRFEQMYSIDHGMLSIATFLVQTAILSHFSACLWGMVPLLMGSFPYGEEEHGHEVSASSALSLLPWPPVSPAVSFTERNEDADELAVAGHTQQPCLVSLLCRNDHHNGRIWGYKSRQEGNKLPACRHSFL